MKEGDKGRRKGKGRTEVRRIMIRKGIKVNNSKKKERRMTKGS